MADTNSNIRNYARGGRSFHHHRFNIIREIIDGGFEAKGLSSFLRDRLFKIRHTDFAIFSFGPKDWELCERLLSDPHGRLAEGMLDLVVNYISANLESVARLYCFNSTISGRLLTREAQELEPDSDLVEPLDALSLFGIRVGCAQNHAATDVVRRQLEDRFPPRTWGRQRLIYPLIHCFVNRPSATSFETFLSYLVTGREHNAEKMALRLILSDEASRSIPLAFRAYVGMMAHPYDACEFVLDHVEFLIASGAPLSGTIRSFIDEVAAMLPGTRAEDLAALLNRPIVWQASRDSSAPLGGFDLANEESDAYRECCEIVPNKPFAIAPGATRPFAILLNMRGGEYPDPLQFQIVTSQREVWFFVDGGRFIGALLRSMYMIDRADRDLEARDAIRLMRFLGYANSYVAAAPSGMLALRLLDVMGALGVDIDRIEREVSLAIETERVFVDRLWIVDLQWTLRRLEEQGRVREWLGHVRSSTRLKPGYLTGINWQWVDEIVNTRRLKPFMSFDGAYLFLLMELETPVDPQRLRLTLEPLIAGKTYNQAVALLIDEFKGAAPAIVRRYMTTQTMLASGLAPNLVAALDQRVRALEACIRQFNYGPLLTEEMYDSEEKALTAQLLLTNVNSGKFEVPWETYRKDALQMQNELYLSVASLRSIREDEPQQSSMIESLITFANGRNETFRMRVRQQPTFALLVAIIDGYMQHPAFGLEIILSGRFRHNNLLQELLSAITGVTASSIPSVLAWAQAELIMDYKTATELVLEDWCSVNMQSVRPSKPRGLFDIIPSQKEMDALIGNALTIDGLSETIDLIIGWLKDKLRGQVAAASDRFVEDVGRDLAASFATVKAAQEGPRFRATDVSKVHAAVSDAVNRRIDELRAWFDGVDTVAQQPISLYNLSLAAETLFENLDTERAVVAHVDQDVAGLLFDPPEVKIAFDLLREIYYNAFRFGSGPRVDLKVSRRDEGDVVSCSFANRVPGPPATTAQILDLPGSRYQGRDDALFREGNSGRAKTAASAATLIGEDATVRCIMEGDTYEIIVPIRRMMPRHAA